ncbi:MAG TPA: hypothetical protein PLW65_08970 [Pseudomonadota bacterium]|nr:hypothetical protein [Pseudomonadota bacterium]
MPARSAAQSVSAEPFIEPFTEPFIEPFTEPFGDPPIRRYAMHWLQHAAARINKRHVRTPRQRLLTEAAPGIDHLFDLSDIPTRPFRRVRQLHSSESGAHQALNHA